jgi:hypothetical protein
MTKIQVKYALTRPLDDQMMNAISRATSNYGILAVKLAATLDQVTVEYDASRLRREHVERTLAQSGLPIQPAV